MVISGQPQSSREATITSRERIVTRASQTNTLVSKRREKGIRVSDMTQSEYPPHCLDSKSRSFAKNEVDRGWPKYHLLVIKAKLGHIGYSENQ